MKKPEVTSKKVASIAGWLLQTMKNATADGWATITFPQMRNIDATVRVRSKALKAALASALTQAEDKPKHPGWSEPGPLTTILPPTRPKPKRKKPARKGKR